MNEAQLVKTIKVHIAKGDQAKDKAEQHYIAAGQHLKTLKAEHNGSWAEWEKVVRDKIGIGKSRASELMQIADGRKTVAEVRGGTAGRMRQLRSPSRDGEDKPVKPAPVDADEDDMPTEQEASESEQQTYYQHARRLVECMTDQTRQKFFAHIRGKTYPLPVPQDAIATEAAAEDDPDVESEVASPEVIEENAMDTLEQHAAVARAYRKIFKASASSASPLGPEASARINAAINGLLTKWRSTKGALKLGAGQSGDDGAIPECLLRG